MAHPETAEERAARALKAKEETDKDLEKSIQQLVIDTHDGAFDPNTTEELLATH